MMLDLQDVTCAQYTASKSMEVLQRALGDRVVAMSAVCRSGSAMEDSAHSPSLPFDEDASTASWVVTVGLVLSPEHASRRVDRGPSADEEEVGFTAVTRRTQHSLTFPRRWLRSGLSGAHAARRDASKTALS
jgi:hypothetical protein